MATIQAAKLDDVSLHDVNRYPNLTSLEAPTPPPPRLVVKKQVDQKWLARLDECKLTEQDL